MQHVVIHCLNFSVWKSAEDQPAAQGSVRFKAWSGEVFEVGGELEPEVLEDSCWVRHDVIFPLVGVYLQFQTCYPACLLHVVV